MRTVLKINTDSDGLGISVLLKLNFGKKQERWAVEVGLTIIC